MKKLNRYLENAKPSATYGVMDKVAEMKAKGETVISLSAGESDFATPQNVRAAAIEAISNGHTRYTQVAGLKSLREAVALKFQRENSLDVDWDETLICNGGKQVIFNALAATLNSGDEVVVPAPYWVSYPDMVQLCGGKSVIVPCSRKSNYKLTPGQLEDALTEKTRWLILNSPSNPTGAVYTREELVELARVLNEQPQVMILCDDIYEHLVFDRKEFFTLAQVAPELKERILTMNGVSKGYAMTGWRIGYCTGPKWLIQAMAKLQGQQTSGACSISQHAALEALTGPQDFIDEARVVFERRRDLVVDLVNAIPGLSCNVPDGAFYIFVDCSGILGKTSSGGRLLQCDEDVVMAILAEAKVATVHGSAFGLPDHVRIAYTLDDDSLIEACRSIRSFCEILIDWSGDEQLESSEEREGAHA